MTNYLAASILGFALFSDTWDARAMEAPSWMWFAILCSVLFISLFVLMGLSAQKNGVALTSTAVKMSMAISMLFMIFYYQEQVTILKWIGIFIAFVSVALVTFSKEKSDSSKPLFLLILFLGSGVLDFVLNYVQKFELGILSPALFSAFGFAGAFFIGIIILSISFLRKKEVFHWKNVLAGICLGIPNYFSIYLLIQSYKATGWDDSTVLAVNNVAVVALSAILGFAIFQERLSRVKQLGLALSLVAIYLLYLSDLV
ncbi:MAG: DMT family transporter [Bacteroidota bacterium]